MTFGTRTGAERFVGELRLRSVLRSSRLQAPPLFPGPRLARQDPGDNLPRPSNADVQETRRKFRRASSLRPPYYGFGIPTDPRLPADLRAGPGPTTTRAPRRAGAPPLRARRGAGVRRRRR